MVDLLLCMTVNPGWSGQSFIEASVPKGGAPARPAARRRTGRGGRRDRRGDGAEVRRGRRDGLGCGVRGDGLRRSGGVLPLDRRRGRRDLTAAYRRRRAPAGQRLDAAVGPADDDGTAEARKRPCSTTRSFRFERSSRAPSSREEGIRQSSRKWPVGRVGLAVFTLAEGGLSSISRSRRWVCPREAHYLDGEPLDLAQTFDALLGLGDDDEPVGRETSNFSRRGHLLP